MKAKQLLLLNNKKSLQKLRRKYKIHRKNDNENYDTQNLQVTAKAVLREKSTVTKYYLKKQEISQINNVSDTPKATRGRAKKTPMSVEGKKL